MPLDETGARNKTLQLDAPSEEMSTARYLKFSFKMFSDVAEGERHFNAYPDSPPPIEIPEIIKFDHVVTENSSKLISSTPIFVFIAAITLTGQVKKEN